MRGGTNVSVKPNKQTQACLMFAMARKRARIEQQFALALAFVFDLCQCVYRFERSDAFRLYDFSTEGKPRAKARTRER